MNTNDQNILHQLPQSTPPDNVWDKIEAVLDRDDKRRIAPLWWRYTKAAAVLLLLCGVSYLMFKPMPGDSPAPVKQQVLMPENGRYDTPAPVQSAQPPMIKTDTMLFAVNDSAKISQTNTYYASVNGIANGSTYHFIATGQAAQGSAGTSYNWSFGDGNGNGTSHSYTMSGSYTVGLTANSWNACIPSGKFTVGDIERRRYLNSDNIGFREGDLGRMGTDADGDGVSDYFDDEYTSNTESYAPLIENEFLSPRAEPLSTFSIDVDNASYANSRRMINSGSLPPKDAVRIEEFINYFDYNYPQPKDSTPFSINLETASCPWNKETKLVQIGIQGKDVDRQNLPASNLVFLIDVSGSMEDENKLPLVKQSLKLLAEQMQPRDRIAVVTYAGAAGLALKSTACSEKEAIKKALSNLEAGGSTAGGEGLALAYKVAKENFKANGNNRIILVTDGDFNVGLQSDDDMKTLIEDKRKDGIFLTVCGFGMGNYKDSKMEILADYGNGNYYYIDNYKESNKVFVQNLTGTLFTIAKDVKIQVEFNPKLVKAYRLIGYENRKMAAEDFADDTKDAGELGAGHTVTALYEIIPAGSSLEVPGFTELKYQQPQPDMILKDFGNEMMTVKLRYKKPDGETSMLLQESLNANNKSYEEASGSFRFASGVVVYGMMLRDSKFKAQSSYALAKSLLEGSGMKDADGYRAELLQLIDKTQMLTKPQ